MDPSGATLWWVAAGVLVAAELATGTFYLLMVALGAVAGALAAHLALSAALQVTTAAVVGGAATLAWHFSRRGRQVAAPAQSNRDVNLDIGQHVQVAAWNADGSAQVRYRGAAWTVRHAGKSAPAPGEHVIVAVEGSHLMVAAVQQHPAKPLGA